jgi:7-keto-8-aminopelargonate synthetase-like enzyme
MFTLGKSLGSVGGVVLANAAELVQYLVQHARAPTSTTPRLPPVCAAAAFEALRDACANRTARPRTLGCTTASRRFPPTRGAACRNLPLSDRQYDTNPSRS